jgi:hypothetical protein
MGTCLPSSTIREMQIKTSLRAHLTLVRMAVIKKQTTNSGMDAGEKKPLHTVGGNVSKSRHYGNQKGGPQSTKNKSTI